MGKTYSLEAGDIELSSTREVEDEEISFDEFRDSLKEAETTGLLKAYRMMTDDHNAPVPNAKSIALLFSVPIDQYSFEEICAKIRREFIRPGQNEIWVRLVGTRKAGRGVQPGAPFSKIICIEKANDGTAGPESRAGEMADILRAVQESTDKQMAVMQGMFREMMASQQQRLDAAARAPQADPIDTAMKMVTAMTGMMTVMQAKTAPQVAAATGGGLLEQLETFKALKSFAKDLVGKPAATESGDDDSLTGVITSVTPLATKLLDVLNTSRAQPGYGQRQPPPLPAPAPAAAPPPHSETDKINQSQISEVNMLAFLRPQLATLVTMAGEGADPKVVAEMTLKALPESMDGQLLEFLEDGKWFDKLAVINPAIRAQQDWFLRLREAILAEYEEPDAPPTA